MKGLTKKAAEFEPGGPMRSAPRSPNLNGPQSSETAAWPKSKPWRAVKPGGGQERPGSVPNDRIEVLQFPLIGEDDLEGCGQFAHPPRKNGTGNSASLCSESCRTSGTQRLDRENGILRTNRTAWICNAYLGCCASSVRGKKRSFACSSGWAASGPTRLGKWPKNAACRRK